MSKVYLQPKEIYPYICVYSDLIEDPAEIYGIAKHISNSEKNFLFYNYAWSHFGNYSSTRIPKDPTLDLSMVKKMAGGGMAASKMGAVKTAAPSRDGIAVKGKTVGKNLGDSGKNVGIMSGAKGMKKGGMSKMKKGGYC
jgi:hypothetical protein